MFINKYLIWISLVIWGSIWCYTGVYASKYQITKKPNCDGTLKPATCDIILKVPISFCANNDENGITFYYNEKVNRLYLR